MACDPPNIDFLRAIPAAARQRSQSEFLAALESRALLLRHYGPGKDPGAVSKKVNRELFLRLFAAALTMPGAHPPVFREGVWDPASQAFHSFWDRTASKPHRYNGLYDIKKEKAPFIVFFLYQVMQFLRNESPILESPLEGTKIMIGALKGYLDGGEQAAWAAAMRRAWPAFKLSLEDLTACSHYITGCLMRRMGRIDEAVAEFKSAVELACAAPAGGGLAWRVVWGVPAELMEEGRYATAAALCHAMLERYKADGADPLRLWWLSCAAAQAQALGGDWDPSEARAMLEEARAALEESQFEVWGGDVFHELAAGVSNVGAIVAAGGAVAAATGRRRLGALGHVLFGEAHGRVETQRSRACCDWCGESGPTWHCRDCRAARYCCAACAKKDWKQHRAGCKQAQATLADLKAEISP